MPSASRLPLRRRARRGVVLSVAVGLLCLLIGCDDFVIYPFLEKELTIEPSAGLGPVTVPEDGQILFTASGGKKPYRFSVQDVNGGISNGLFIPQSDQTGLTGVVRVTDNSSPPQEAATRVVIIPAAPANLVADGKVDNDPKHIQLRWQDRSNSEDGFIIERRTSQGVFAQIGTVGDNVESYDDYSARPEEPGYYYRVRSFKGALYSESAVAGPVRSN